MTSFSHLLPSIPAHFWEAQTARQGYQGGGNGEGSITHTRYTFPFLLTTLTLTKITPQKIKHKPRMHFQTARLQDFKWNIKVWQWSTRQTPSDRPRERENKNYSIFEFCPICRVFLSRQPDLLIKTRQNLRRDVLLSGAGGSC